MKFPEFQNDWFSQQILIVEKSIANKKNILICYNSDADGLFAAVFLYKYFKNFNKNIQIDEKPIFNFQYDFEVIETYVAEKSYDLVFCVDLPIIQETNVVNFIAEKCKLIIYDHHMILNYEKNKLNKNILYVNSRDIDLDTTCTYFSAMLYSTHSKFNKNDLYLMTIGLIGDWAFDKNPWVKQKIVDYFSIDSIQTLNNYTKKLNGYFRANTNLVYSDIVARLALVKPNSDVVEQLNIIGDNYQLDSCIQIVDAEIKSFVDLIVQEFEQDEVKVYCQILACRTFCVGVVASILAQRFSHTLFSLGFESNGKVQFELRTNRENNIQIVDVLREQRKYFSPLTSGGHPKAAGALVPLAEEINFKNSLNLALQNLQI